MINFRMAPVPEALSRDIECIRVAEYSGTEPLEVKICPSGYPGMVFQIAEGKTAAIEKLSIFPSAGTANNKGVIEVWGR